MTGGEEAAAEAEPGVDLVEVGAVADCDQERLPMGLDRPVGPAELPVGVAQMAEGVAEREVLRRQSLG